ncbi:VCBS repeat-containing protein [Brevundimonas sp. 2R-24]|uniref:VCBS repeat-containing protein n=1 Tax=Peiella sedimenti TaxID=3061083 RepID=A0ABT8SL44_9CAUL|nr:VCBS repeat-containing protein [Caulobacteraceae bacterium XZ-24]
MTKVSRLLMAASVLALMGGACQAQSATEGFGVRFEDVTETHLPGLDAMPRRSMDAVAHDLDGDGDLDVVLPGEWAPSKIMINDGQGRFTMAETPFPPIPAEELVKPPHVQAQLNDKDSEDVSIADFDGDGLADLMIVVEDDIMLGRSNVHQYLRGRPGDGYERIYGQLPDTVANAVAHADVDGDGDLDLALIGGSQDRLLINDGRGRFSDETETRIPREAATAQDGEFFDADGDGDLDLVLGLEGGHALWINDGRGVFADESRARLPVPGNVEARKVTVGDVDGDGDLDLFFAHVSWQGRAPQDHLYLNDGSGRFSNATDRLPQETELTLDALFHDLDGDGDLDLVRGNGGSLKVWANDGTGRFTDVTGEVMTNAELPGSSIAVEVADFNGDGLPDIYVGQLAQGGPADPSRDRLFLGRRR